MNSSVNLLGQSNLSLNEDFWTELDSISECETDQLPTYTELDEDNTSQKSLEDLAEVDWLNEAGFQDIVHSLKDESLTSTSTSLDELLALSLSIPLTERQTKTVKKRFNTLQKALIKQKGSKRGQEVVQIVSAGKHRPDVRSLFDNPCAQPVNISSKEIAVSESDGNVASAHGFSLDVPNRATQRRGSSPDLLKMSRDRTYSTPPEPEPQESNLIKYKTKHNFLNMSKSTTNLKKESSSRFSWSGYKKAFKLNNGRRNSSTLDTETGIEALSLKYKSSLRGQEDRDAIEKDKNRLSTPPANDYFIEDRITAQGLGIEVAINSQTQYTQRVIPELRLSSQALRLEDLSPEMRKKLKTLAMIELSAVLDMYDLEYEKFKRKKLKKRIKKHSDNVIFGVSLNDLYNLDLKRNPNHSLPSILQFLFNYIRMNGLHEEGIFRITGSQNRVLALKEELENQFNFYYNSSYRERTEEVFAILSKYSIYDICSVLKHFIRELPDPLLTCELVEAFLLVPKITDFLQQIQVLNLLILMMSDSHRNTLEALLFLFNDITTHEHLNKMTVHNMATIMAPNLFPNLAEKKRSRQTEALKEMESILERAQDSFAITKTLILNYLVLFHVPPYLMGQINQRKK